MITSFKYTILTGRRLVIIELNIYLKFLNNTKQTFINTIASNEYINIDSDQIPDVIC